MIGARPSLGGPWSYVRATLILVISETQECFV